MKWGSFFINYNYFLIYLKWNNLDWISLACSKNKINLLLFSTRDFQKSRFGNKQTNPSRSMITITLQSYSNYKMILVILQNNLLRPFNPILQWEIINKKCKKRKQEWEMYVNKKWKGRKVNDTKGLWGYSDGQAQEKSESYEEDQDLKAEHSTNLHYFHQYIYIPARNESGGEKIWVLSTRRLIKIHP